MDLTHDKGQKSNVEIERKFLVLSTEYRDKSVRKYTIRQGYVFASKDKSVRVRLTDEEAYLTIKGETLGPKRKEFEYSIPTTDAEQLLNSLCLKPLIEKTRYLVEDKGFIWEVDEFLGDNIGLVVAEVELNDEQVHLELPDWVGKEVTEDTRFYNSVLFQSPFCFWPLEERQKILRTK
ncbi:adenylate cyclase [Galdieria sulphuraria]|uniref:Adenylate cyclase n=1 Tax=Galdieria sulphuraria TaxID=130081 RepID=M2XV90_GALSU|nr:adenylate cyclase [Galdieria sulphuraria]EME27578.1 adenylate cyclase [Galdieria sulphuraria]|eukprot:XP_005704098.1 adenylate cyclase [Galdieria sulphuraria]